MVGQPAHAQDGDDGAYIAHDQIGGKQASAVDGLGDLVDHGHARQIAQCMTAGHAQNTQSEQPWRAGKQIENQQGIGRRQGEEADDDQSLGGVGSGDELDAGRQKQDDANGQTRDCRSVPGQHLGHEAGGHGGKQAEHAEGGERRHAAQRIVVEKGLARLGDAGQNIFQRQAGSVVDRRTGRRQLDLEQRMDAQKAQCDGRQIAADQGEWHPLCYQAAHHGPQAEAEGNRQAGGRSRTLQVALVVELGHAYGGRGGDQARGQADDEAGGAQTPGIPGQGRADDAHGHHHQSQAQHFEKTEEVGQTAQKQQADQGAQHIGHENLRDMAGLQPPGLLVERVERAGKRRSHDADAHGKADPGIGAQTGLHWEGFGGAVIRMPGAGKSAWPKIIKND